MLIFGEKESGKNYITRPAVYGVMFNSGKDQVAVIQVQNGNYFLPGGGIENNETHEECLKREVLEETGMKVEISHMIGSAGRYFYAVSEDTYYLSEGTFYACKAGGKIGAPIDEDHVLKWMEPSEVMECLLHEHQRWAVREFRQVHQTERNLTCIKC